MSAALVLASVITGMSVRRFLLYDVGSLAWARGYLFSIVGGALLGLLISPIVVWCLWRKNYRVGLFITFMLALATAVVANTFVRVPQSTLAGPVVLLLGCLLLSRFLSNTLAGKLGHCPECDFDLRGQSLEGCPECGWRREAKGAGES